MNIAAGDRGRQLASGNNADLPRVGVIVDKILVGYALVSTAEQNPDHQTD